MGVWFAFSLCWTELVSTPPVSQDHRMEPQAPGAVPCLSFLTRTEHSVIWKPVISLGAVASLWPVELSRALQPQQCRH